MTWKIGRLGVKLNIDKKAILQAQQARLILFHIRKKFKESLKELERQDIIEPVPENQSTPWLSPIAAMPKKMVQCVFVLICA